MLNIKIIVLSLKSMFRISQIRNFSRISLISLLILSLLFTQLSFLITPVYAASSPWTQTDWSGGSGQTSWLDTTKFDSSSNVTTSTTGQVTLANTEELSNTGFESDLSSWSEVPTYNLNDQFTTDRAAGAVNGTAAEPTGGTRTVTDTNNKISISSGLLNFATGEAATDGIRYSGQARSTGTTTVFKINTVSGSSWVGIDDNTSGFIYDAFRFVSGVGINIWSNGALAYISSFSTSTDYYVAVVQRSSGVYWFIKGGSFTNWTLMFMTTGGTYSTFYPRIISEATTAVFSNDFIRSLTSTWLPTPLAYDTFTRADGAIGSSETTGPDSQTTPSLTWTSQTGTFTVVSNKAVGSTLSDGIAIATLPTTSTISGLHDAALVRNAGDVGIVVRYVDSNNYIKAIHNGTNIQLIKVVAGTPTTLINSAATYVSGAVIRVICDATKFRVYYNNTLIGTEQTISDSALQSGVVGLYTSDVGNTFDNVTTFARNIGFADAPFEELTVTRDTATTYSSSAGSAKLIAGGVDANYLQSVNVGDTNAYNFTAYAYTTGSAVTGSDAELYTRMQ